jgi:hypothetical protein
MIANIAKGKYFKGIIDYNEKKVSAGVARLIDNTTFETGRLAINQLFLGLCNNENTVTRKGGSFDATRSQAVHISLNFPPLAERELSDEFLADYTATYMKEMGYANHPYLLYRHFDAGHTHLHIITSRYDWESRKLSTTYDWKRSNQVSIRLSRQYDLPEWSEYSTTGEKHKKTLQELNKERYSVHKAIKKALAIKKHAGGLNHFLSQAENTYLRGAGPMLGNTQVQSLVGQERFTSIVSYLDSRSLFNPLVKSQLHIHIKAALEESRDLPSFVGNLKARDIYVREVYNRKIGKTGLKYGFAGKYFNEGSLNPLCRLRNINSHFYGCPHSANYGSGKAKAAGFTVPEQSEFIKKRVNFILRSKKGISCFESLQQQLNRDNIELITYQNAGGVYGVAFKSHNAADPAVIKGSEIDISVSKLQFWFSRARKEPAGMDVFVNSILADNHLSAFRDQRQPSLDSLQIRDPDPAAVTAGTLGIFAGMGQMDDTAKLERDANDVRKRGKKKARRRRLKGL